MALKQERNGLGPSASEIIPSENQETKTQLQVPQAMGLTVPWLSFWPSPSLSASAALTMKAESLGCCAAVATNPSVTSGSRVSYRRLRSAAQDCRCSPHVDSIHLLPAGFPRPTSRTHILPSWQSLVQPLQCSIAMPTLKSRQSPDRVDSTVPEILWAAQKHRQCLTSKTASFFFLG